MKDIEIVETCPLGSVCEEIKDGKLHRCKWFIEIDGENPQTGKQNNYRDCAIPFIPIAVLENARWSRGTQSAVESNRDVMTDFHQVFKRALQNNRQTKQLKRDDTLSLTTEE